MRLKRVGAQLLLCLFLGLSGCGGLKKTVRIGIDAAWYPIDFGPQQPYINGLVEELLVEISRYTGLEFERIDGNWDSLFDGLKERKYAAVLSSLPLYDFNRAKYDFSQHFLLLGPVLIIPVASGHHALEQMQGERVGIVLGDPAQLILEKHPEIVLRTYLSVPELLDALSLGEIEGALLDQIPAAGYVRDLYAGKLKIASPPLTDAGLRLIVLKGEETPLLKAFNRSLDQLKKKQQLQALLEKWGLLCR